MNAQEQFWSSDFGNEYTKRNRVSFEDRVPFWRGIIRDTGARSILDVGTNAGWNLRALRQIDRTLHLVGIDVNEGAVAEACSEGLDVRHVSILDAAFEERFDLVCTSGVLIHVARQHLDETMLAIIKASSRYVLAVEYRAQREEEVLYHGHAQKLWRRPYGGLYEGLGLTQVDGGNADGFDRCHWWLMSKTETGLRQKGVNGFLSHTEI